ncbi:MAG: ABC transporter permease [Bacillota bacterium]|nr:ABC transporter permease [Bacillota bacterium]
MLSIERGTRAFSRLMIAVYIIILLVPALSLALYSGTGGLAGILLNRAALDSIKLGMYTSALSLLATFAFGTPAAFYISSRKKKLLAGFLDIFFQIPVVLPPAAAGIGLLLAFGRNGFMGRLLGGLGINMVFTPAAVVMAQFFVSSAFYVQVLKTAVEDIPQELYEASYVMGAGRSETVIRVMLPMTRKAVISGLLLSYIRALGEFGTTIMFAGNIAEKTRTIPLQIYTFLQTDMVSAAALASLLYIGSFTLLFIVKAFLGKG